MRRQTKPLPFGIVQSGPERDRDHLHFFSCCVQRGLLSFLPPSITLLPLTTPND